MRVAVLVDTTRCIGCRSCQVACKQAHGLKADSTRFFAAPGGYQNPGNYSPYTRTYVSYHELDDEAGPLKWIFVKHQCLHCADMPCARVCAQDVYHRTKTGVVAYDAGKCMGCAACTDECPFGVPTIDYWDVPTPYIRKCSFCLERQESEMPGPRLNGRPLEGEQLRRYLRSFQTPACAKACPSGALQFGDRDQLLAEARQRIAEHPDRYFDHIYGEKELGGCAWLYLFSVAPEKLGFPRTFAPSSSQFNVLGAVPRRQGVLASLGAAFAAATAGLTWIAGRRNKLAP